MSKPKRGGRPPQAQHNRKSGPSQHDKRQRLGRSNPLRRSTQQAAVPISGAVAQLAAAMSRMLDPRIAFRLPIVLAGAILASGRRTAASWFRCAAVKDVTDRWGIEEPFHDVKEVWGAGQQQVRSVWSSIGCWNLCGWLFDLVELASWDLPAEQLVDREDRPWDNPARRPSHADRRRRIAREMLRNEFLTDLPTTADEAKTKEWFERLLSLAA